MGCQHSVKIMREAGLKPDMLFCRSEGELKGDIRKKLSLFCQVHDKNVISMHDVNNIYHVPLLMAEQNVGVNICEKLGFGDRINNLAPVLAGARFLGAGNPDVERLGDWAGLAGRVDSLTAEIRIAMVGKYTGLTDSYMSVIKALTHAAIEAGLQLKIEWIESTDLEPNTRNSDHKRYDTAWKRLRGVDGVLVPGGFGTRGIEGMILAAKYCRESCTPYFGICVGMQVAVIEACRNLLGHEEANSSEFDESTPHPCVLFMPEVSATVMGGTMRLGSRCTIIRDPMNTLAGKVYSGQPVIYERHRHRYEVNSAYVQGLENKGLKFSGQDERGQRMEIIELEDHPFFFAVQFHPEFKSRPNRPSPCFLAFILASGSNLNTRLEEDGGKLNIGAGFEKPVQASKETTNALGESKATGGVAAESEELVGA